jgi:hypothetical protein
MSRPLTRRRALALSAATSVSLAGLASAQPQGTPLMPHLVLLGDSVFDNVPYVAAGEEVVEQLRRRLLPD